jgi:ferritin-like metal-binding protein YciE
MAANTLADLYVEQLKDLYSAERQILKALPKMVKAASHDELRNAFQTHLRQTEEHVARLERIFEALEKSPKGKTCHGMQGIIEEGGELMKEDADPAVLDAGLISAAQHVEHYEMAGYGCVRTWAEQLGYDEHADVLRKTLEEEKETDALLTQLAEQSVNSDAQIEEGGLADARPRAKSKTTRGAASRPQPRAESRRAD